MSDLCNDNRFELIEKYKKKLIESTNIETAPEEMKVIDNILFRFWQMGWLDKLELSSKQSQYNDLSAEDFSKEISESSPETESMWFLLHRQLYKMGYVICKKREI